MKCRKTPMKHVFVAAKDHPCQGLIGVQHRVAFRKTPFGGVIVVWLGVEAGEEETRERRMRDVHHGNDASGHKYSTSLSEELPYIGDVVEDVREQERLYGLVREGQFTSVDNEIGHTKGHVRGNDSWAQFFDVTRAAA